MRFLKSVAAVVFTCFVLLLNSHRMEASADSISGRLVFEDSTFACEQQCLVTLLVGGARPVQTVVADLAGNFRFTSVPRGPYTIRVEIDGFETVNQVVDAAIDTSVTVSVV